MPLCLCGNNFLFFIYIKKIGMAILLYVCPVGAMNRMFPDTVYINTNKKLLLFDICFLLLNH